MNKVRYEGTLTNQEHIFSSSVHNGKPLPQTLRASEPSARSEIA